MNPRDTAPAEARDAGVECSFGPGQAVVHPRLGDGVLVASDGRFARVFFQGIGEQLVPAQEIARSVSWNEQVVSNVAPATGERLRRLRLALEAREIPRLDGAASLTAAKIELLPHQIVLTHRVATAPSRRFLIADDVGLGKTIETALLLRELASRGELTRALMVVPAGLVENWRRELNEVFRLNFEVFGSDGDVTDRRTNVFASHHRLIASIDTLKRPSRMERLAEAPAWDLVVFDEAQHLTAVRSGNRVRKTDNYHLAEALRDQCRDLLLLSATPHQGDHFRFLSLLRLLNPSLFRDERDMLDNRHRLNAVVIRRTKADACRSDGSQLFARRQVHTQLFYLSAEERRFYEALSAYIRDGYELARSKGGRGRAVGFVMTVFQKIAASSFAAVRRTLERRLLTLTVHEAMGREQALDINGRDELLREARSMVARIHALDDSPIGRAQADALLAEVRLRLLKKLEGSATGDEDSEATAASDEEGAAMLATYALPEERGRIRDLLELAPSTAETKTLELLAALEQLWAQNPSEKIIIFTTYLAGVDALRVAIERRFPGSGIEVLKGGDHGAKTAAERRFRRPDGPRVLICTAAGREGINLQFARVLFNHDLPWNPMDLEQRIGRIHRYGQNDTAQVYNLVASDTIEGRVFLLLEEKIKGVVRALGKLDDRGEVAEDLRSQILGQLGERLSFTQLYQEALRDPTLVRTNQELEAALTNASRAERVVGELFQDLEPFRLDEYRAVNSMEALARLKRFLIAQATARGGSAEELTGTRFRLAAPDSSPVTFTLDRDEALTQDSLELLGLEHPLVAGLLTRAAGLDTSERALSLADAHDNAIEAVWEVTLRDSAGGTTTRLLDLRTDKSGAMHCSPYSEGTIPTSGNGCASTEHSGERLELATRAMPACLRDYLMQVGLLEADASYSIRLLAWIERVPSGAVTINL